MDAFHCSFCGMPRVQVLINSALGFISSHDSPPPPGAGNGGRRRTCLRELCWLKSIEVEDEKITNLKKSFALSWDLPVDTCLYFKFKVFMSHFENIDFFVFLII